MRILEMFKELGLSNDTINQLLADVNLYNYQHPEKPMPLIKLDADIDTVKFSHTPMIGRAIVKERGRLFWDDEQQFPLTFDENAMRYGSYELARFYGAEHLFLL